MFKYRYFLFVLVYSTAKLIKKRRIANNFSFFCYVIVIGKYLQVDTLRQHEVANFTFQAAYVLIVCIEEVVQRHRELDK